MAKESNASWLVFAAIVVFLLWYFCAINIPQLPNASCPNVGAPPPDDDTPAAPDQNDTPAPDEETYTCGWQTTTAGFQCGGTCPSGKTCEILGRGCLCVEESQHTGGVVGTIYVTSVYWNGAVGNLDGADLKCANNAYYAGLEGGWIALISSSTIDAKDRLPDIPYYRLDGKLIASSRADLLDGTIANPIYYNEKMEAATGSAWTGTNAQGDYVGGETRMDCNNWGWVSAYGTAGNPTQTGSEWINVPVSYSCGDQKHLYCVRIF